MNDQIDRSAEQLPIFKQIMLHLAPGLLAVGLFVLLSVLLAPARFPPFLVVQLTLPVLILAELGIILFMGKRQTGKASIVKMIRFTARVK